LNCVNTSSASCTTAPMVNIFDVSGATTTLGMAKICNNTQDTTAGTFARQAETLPMIAGDFYGIYVSTQGGTCTTSAFTVTADIACP